MKIKAIAQIISKRKFAVLYQGEGEQWLSDGVAMYSLAGLPELRLSGLFRIFDISEDKAAEYMQREEPALPADICMEEYAEGDERLELQDFVFARMGYTFCVLATEDGKALLVQERYFKPFEDAEALEYTLRKTPGGKSYITVHDGMFTVAVLLPFDDAGGGIAAYISALGTKLITGTGGEKDG